MWPVTQLYLDTLARNHTQVVRVDVLKAGVLFARLTNGTIIDPGTGNVLTVVGGSVSVDRATIRRNCTVQFTDVSGQLAPKHIGDLLAPFVTELRIWVGVQYWNTSGSPTSTNTEYVPVGTFVITGLDANYPVVNVSGYDRMWILGTFTSPYTIAANTAIDDAINNILSDNIPHEVLTTLIPNTEFTTPSVTYDAQASVADAIQNLAMAASWQLYCDPMGTFVATNEPSTDDVAVLTFNPGQASVMLRPEVNIGGGATGTDMYNAVVFTGEGSDSTIPPVRGYAEDDDPNSLTYVNAVGVRAYFESSPLVTTTAQANTAAATSLQRVLGVSVSTIVPIIPNHALESGDVIHVTDPLQNIDDNFIVDSFTVALRAADGIQAITCRSKVIRG